ncbi:hypothetical protein SAMN05444370_11089 [Rubrimonas cliftonensis]|uniref:Uncharacterized protein n=1 Tax=Rubrimonas cliftonensis TaxID=89524 RepID=A0A1H4DKR7_9RHOB|nr:hypothetical protein SAMN05444370_11089 [Rubrimonas cliftonensis]
MGSGMPNALASFVKRDRAWTASSRFSWMVIFFWNWTGAISPPSERMALELLLAPILRRRAEVGSPRLFEIAIDARLVLDINLKTVRSWFIIYARTYP